MKTVFAKKALFTLALAGMATSTVSAAIPEGAATQEVREENSIGRGDKTALYGKATCKQITSYRDASGNLLGQETRTAERFSIELKSLFNATPVASFFYGHVEELPAAEQKIVITSQDAQKLAKDFTKKRAHSFVKQSKDPVLKQLAQLTQNLTKKVHFVLESEKDAESVYVSVEKAQEGFVNLAGYFTTSTGLHYFPVTRVTIYGKTPKASPTLVNLLKTAVINDSWSTGAKVATGAAAATVVVGGIALTDNPISNALFNSDPNYDSEDESAPRGSAASAEPCSKLNAGYLLQQVVIPNLQSLLSHSIPASNIFTPTPNQALDPDHVYALGAAKDTPLIIIENALLVGDETGEDPKLAIFRATQHATFVANALARALKHEKDISTCATKVFVAYEDDFKGSTWGKALITEANAFALVRAGWKIIKLVATRAHTEAADSPFFVQNNTSEVRICSYLFQHNLFTATQETELAAHLIAIIKGFVTQEA
jgi:hypothetical protein